MTHTEGKCLNIHSESKTLFIIPTDAHNYKIIGMLKTIKIPTIDPTCFGSRRNHQQGTISGLANDEHNRIIIVVSAKHEIAPRLWFLLEPKHVGTIVGILIVLTFLLFYNCVHQLE